MTKRRLKILEYATGLLLLFFFAALFYELEKNSAWTIALLFMLSLVSIFFYDDMKRKFYAAQIAAQEKISPPVGAPVESPEETERERKAAHELIVKICASKNIALQFKHENKGGHMDVPETWIIERAVPLTYEDIYAITADKYMSAQMQALDDGIIYAESFAIYSERRIYRQDKNQPINSG